MTGLTEHAARNRAQWDTWAAHYAAAGRRNWAESAPHWGIWHLPDAQVGALGDMQRFAGRDVIAFSEYGASIWCDPHLWIPEAARVLRPGGELVFLANAVLSVLCLPDAGMVTRELQRPQRGMHRVDWGQPGDDSVEFHLPHGAMIDLLGANGLQVERLVEVYAPAGATTTFSYMNAAWASRWPCEEIWIAHKTRVR